MTTAWKVSILVLLLLNVIGNNESSQVPNIYDVLQLIYQICSTDPQHRMENLDCTSYHMGKEVSSIMERCLSQNASQSSIEEYCSQLTQVEEWTSKHRNPPQQLTTVMGLAAFGRMACVIGEVQRPLPMWQAAFTKCFPDFRHRANANKESSQNRKYNIIGGLDF